MYGICIHIALNYALVLGNSKDMYGTCVHVVLNYDLVLCGTCIHVALNYALVPGNSKEVSGKPSLWFALSIRKTVSSFHFLFVVGISAMDALR